MSFKKTSRGFGILLLVALMTGLFAVTAVAAGNIGSNLDGTEGTPAPVVTAITEGKDFAAVEVNADVNDSTAFSAVYTLKASAWSGNLHTFPLFTIEGVLDPAKLTLTVGDESNPNQVGWVKLGLRNGSENVYAENTGTDIFFNTPAADNVVWTVYYDG
ncbi:MAG: hypothetical protein LBT32_08645, partial [Peptococcaceae bacterium]|nr:hypothetical protein [Peptococcaceae bacterium]